MSTLGFAASLKPTLISDQWYTCQDERKLKWEKGSKSKSMKTGSMKKKKNVAKWIRNVWTRDVIHTVIQGNISLRGFAKSLNTHTYQANLYVENLNLSGRSPCVLPVHQSLYHSLLNELVHCNVRWRRKSSEKADSSRWGEEGRETLVV